MVWYDYCLKQTWSDGDGERDYCLKFRESQPKSRRLEWLRLQKTVLIPSDTTNWTLHGPKYHHRKKTSAMNMDWSRVWWCDQTTMFWTGWDGLEIWDSGTHGRSSGGDLQESGEAPNNKEQLQKPIVNPCNSVCCFVTPQIEGLSYVFSIGSTVGLVLDVFVLDDGLSWNKEQRLKAFESSQPVVTISHRR